MTRPWGRSSPPTSKPATPTNGRSPAPTPATAGRRATRRKMLARRDTTYEQFSIRVDPAGSPTLLKPPTHTGSGASVVPGLVPPGTTLAPPGARTHLERSRSRRRTGGALSSSTWLVDLVPADRGKGRSRWRPHRRCRRRNAGWASRLRVLVHPPRLTHEGRLNDEHTGSRMIRIIAALIAGVVLVVTVQRTWAGVVYALLSRGDR